MKQDRQDGFAKRREARKASWETSAAINIAARDAEPCLGTTVDKPTSNKGINQCEGSEGRPSLFLETTQQRWL